jgi:hypothetical protein
MPTCSGFAGPATTLRRSFTTNKMLYVAILFLDIHLLLEGAIPTATLYPKRRGVNKRRDHVSYELRGCRLPACAEPPRGRMPM